MLRNIIFALFCAYFSAPALGAPFSNVKHLSFNFGSHTEFYNAVQTDDSGGLRKFEFVPTIGLGADLPIEESFHFLPEFNWVLPYTAEDSNIMMNTFMYRVDLGYDIWDWLRVRLGTSIMHQNIHGKGGKTKENNGTGESTFYYPDENRSSLNNTLDVGVEALMGPIAVRLQTYTYSIFREERRQHSYTLFLSYYWGK